jgi:hypothetical protein
MNNGEQLAGATLLCSECFEDEGLRLDAQKLGLDQEGPCPSCRSSAGRKLDKARVEYLAYRFFVRGTLRRTKYGGAPAVQFNDRRYGQTELDVPPWLVNDLRLLQEAARIGFFHYGPRLWMVGLVEPLEALQQPTDRDSVIARILTEYPERKAAPTDKFYRLRKNPREPANHAEYDSPPDSLVGRGRLDSHGLPVMYASQDLEVCIHECRATVEDDLYVATLAPAKQLRLLDLSALVKDDTTEFESIDIAVHMLFLAHEHSYDICRAIARAAKARGFDGLIYPSYFSLLRTGAAPFDTAFGISVRRFPSAEAHVKATVIENVALFGRPIHEGIVKVRCINRAVLNQAQYDVIFGPVKY